MPLHIIQIATMGEDIYGLGKNGKLYYWGGVLIGDGKTELSRKKYGWKIMVDEINE